jgi:hypothetical protein
VRVAWRRPEQIDGNAPTPWAVAGEGDVVPTPVASTPLIWWVGASGPAGARSCPSWSALTALVQDGLRASVGGVRLAPICGVESPGAGYVQGLGWLETLIGAGPAGVPSPYAAEVRRMRAALRRRRLPLTLIEAGGKLRVESER